MSPIAVVDTNVTSYIFRETELAVSYKHLLSEYPQRFISYYSLVEARYGALKKDWARWRRDHLDAFMEQFTVYYPDESLCDRFVALRVDMESRGRNIGAPDLWIAATALELDCPLISHNARHFEQVPGLELLSVGDPN